MACYTVYPIATQWVLDNGWPIPLAELSPDQVEHFVDTCAAVQRYYEENGELPTSSLYAFV